MIAATDRPKLLLVDDDETFRKLLAGELSRRGYAVSAAAGGGAGLKLLREADFDVVLLDMKMPEIDGMQVLKSAREENLPGEIVVLTGHGAIDDAIQAIRFGAYDYVTKPCAVDQMEVKIQKAFERRALVRRNAILSDALAPSDTGGLFVGTSGAFRDLMALVEKVAPTDSSVLIAGETGVGKGMVASLVHTLSPRSGSPFVIVDCGGFHENLLQSELFGHEKGAFTGAARLRHGLFEVADKGTMFLDEIGDVSLETQANLLRVVETGFFRRLGSTREIRVSVRVIAATNKDLQELTRKGLFREDLFFRLGTLRIRIPPLRQRRDDIPTLAAHFTGRLNQRYGQNRSFSREALDAMVAYSWPGNARELSHVVEQAFVLSDNPVIQRDDLPPHIIVADVPLPAGVAPGSPLPSLREAQARYVEMVLRHTGGNRAGAARILQISVRNLYRMMRRHGLDPRAQSAESGDGLSPP